jgi:large subunit ribosomal protein L32e
MRYGKTGKPKAISSGYRAPSKIRGLTAEGLVPVVVSNVPDLKSVEEKQAVIISKHVGKRKKFEIVKKADELSIKILNVKDPKEYIKKVSQELQKKKEEKQKTAKEKEKKKAEKEKKAEEKKKEDLAEKLTDEEKKEQEKKERDKVLTKKES